MDKPRSHAQFGEDLVLWNALSDVERGFYIDAGAADPALASVTKLFYDRGWTGINIEPRPDAFKKLCRDREADLNAQLILQDNDDAAVMTIYEITEQPGLSTTRRDYADNWNNSGMPSRSHTIPCGTLSGLCGRYVRGPIHFLKIDVEGAEAAVIKGADFDRFRPWLLAIEATVPGTYTPCHEEWEHLVLAAGYEFALFHEINRYYVAREHSDRKGRIVAPS